MQREYDIVVYGASGCTGKHIVRRLVGKDLVRFALAGRSAEAIRRNVCDVRGGESIPVIECPAERAVDVTRRTRLLLNCAGPYIFSGEKIVGACVETGTHYLDITGETFFVESVLKRYDEEARRKGIYVINCCGFDSIPADVGVERLKKRINDNAEIMSVMRLKKACLNKTTYESLIFGLKNADAMRRLRGPRRDASRSQVQKYFYNKRTRSYNVIFMGTDPSVVKRTQRCMGEKRLNHAGYLAYLDVGGYFNLTVFKILFVVITLLAKFEAGRKILLRFPSLFTCGRVKPERPKDADLAKGSFEILFFGKGLGSGEEMKMIVRGPDPGYYTTSICAVEASLCLLDMVKDGRRRLFQGGVLTPGCAFYETDLVDRLRDSGVEFEFMDD